MLMPVVKSMVDLTELNNHIISEVGIDLTVNFDKEYLVNTEMLELTKIEVHGNIVKNSNNDNILSCVAKGRMLIKDAISFEPVEYPFEIEIIDEVIENFESDANSLDIKEILWQNIVLEIPLKFTVEKDLSKFQGDGWKLISEDELKEQNNPFNDLKSKLGEE